MDNETTLLLPDDIEEEILSRLPVKSLLRFKCVSKPWRSLIDNNRFIKKHLQNNTNNRTYDNRRVIKYCKEHGLNQHGPNPSSLRSYFDEPFLDLTPIDDPKNEHLMSGIVVDSCNGLFCIYKAKPSRAFFLWNPATRISIELPKSDLPNPPLLIQKWGFGWDEESDAYKVFVAMFDSNDQEIGRIYSSKTNSWKRAKQLGNLSSFWDGKGKVACGKIHWLMGSGHIETFDLKSEVFGMMELPNEVFGKMKICRSIKDNFLCLVWSRGFLMVICKNTKDNEKCRVWVMKEYGVKESWVELISKLPKKINHCCTAVVYVESLVSPLLAKEGFCSTSQNPIQVLIGWITRVCGRGL